MKRLILSAIGVAALFLLFSARASALDIHIPDHIPPIIIPPIIFACQDSGLLSATASDYSASIVVDQEGKAYQTVLYGKLGGTTTFDSLPAFSDLMASTNNAVTNWFYAQLYDQKMFVWVYGCNEDGTVSSGATMPIFASCESLGSIASTTGEAFRCTLLPKFPLDGKSRAEVLTALKASPWTKACFAFQPAATCVDNVLHRVSALFIDGSADADSDGVPDVYDNCPSVANFSQEYTAGATVGDACKTAPAPTCEVDVDEDGVCDDGTDQCPDEQGTAENNGCPSADIVNPPAATEGGGCGLVSAASGGFGWLGMLGAAFLPLIARRRRQRFD
jgi:hypothetical protein